MEELTEPDLPDYWLDIRRKAYKADKFYYFIKAK